MNSLAFSENVVSLVVCRKLTWITYQQVISLGFSGDFQVDHQALRQNKPTRPRSYLEYPLLMITLLRGVSLVPVRNKCCSRSTPTSRWTGSSVFRYEHVSQNMNACMIDEYMLNRSIVYNQYIYRI
jgi:hypothetical protein